MAANNSLCDEADVTGAIQLFVLPYAGGNEYAFKAFRQPFAALGFTLVPLDIPGHGKRIVEPLLSDVGAMVDDLLMGIAGRLDAPYAVWGHSMGSLLAYLLLQRIAEKGLPLPHALVVSGRRAPHLPSRQPVRYNLPHDAFLNELRRFGGLPDEALNHPAYLEYALPILRADFRALDTYRHQEQPPLPMKLGVLYGEEDEVTEREADAWRTLVTGPVEVVRVKGGHFFIHDDPQATTQQIAVMMGCG